MLIELTLLGGAAYFLKRKNRQKSINKTPVRLEKKQRPAPKNKTNQQKKSMLKGGLKKLENNKHKNLLLYTAALGAAVLAPLHSIFLASSLAAQLYIRLDFFRIVWKDLKKGRILTVYSEGLVVSLVMLAKGYLILAAVLGIIMNMQRIIVQRTEEKTQQGLTNVFTDYPNTVWIQQNDIEIEVAFETLKAGDIVIVNAGEVLPVDGVIHKGFATIDQHLLTGESQPVERDVGEKVFASTLLLAGRICVQVETTGKETVAARIGNVLNETQYYKEHLMTRGQQIADRLLPVTWGIAAITWPLLGSTAALSVIFASLGFNMVFLGPLSVLAYLKIFSQQGILIKDGRILESLSQVDTIVFDKTGTLTQEQPHVGKIHTFNDYSEYAILRFAVAAEYRQPHPIAKAILAKAQALDIPLTEPTAANYEVGYGITVYVEDYTIRVGSLRFIERENIPLPNTINTIQQQAQEQGYSLIYVSVNQQLAGILEMHPSIRPEAHTIIQKLKQRGYNLCIISGDHEQPTRTLAQQLDIERYFAETLPENKADLVKKLQAEGKFVCFIGDGINDAIALKSAQISVSLKGASTAATDTAQIILMDGSIHYLDNLFQLSDEFESTMKSNLLTTIVPGIICIGGIYILHFGLLASMTTYYIGSVVGLSNSLIPILKYNKKTNPPSN